MAKEKEILNQAVNYDIEATLKTMGFRAGAKDINAVNEYYKTLIKSGETSEKAIGKAVKKFTKGNEKIKKAQKDQRKAVNSLKRAYNTLDGKITGLVKSLAIAGTTGYAFFNTLEDINKEMISLTASSAAFGLSLDDVRSFAEGASKELSLTRKEAMGFLSAYEKGIFDISGPGAEAIGKNIKNVVGGNVDEMKNMMSAINELKGLAPALDFTDMSEANIKRMREEVRQQAILGGLREETIPLLEAYFRQQKAMTPEEEKRVETFKALKRHAESVAVGLATSFMPILEKIAKWFNENEPTMKEMFAVLKEKVEEAIPWLEKLAIGFAALKLAQWTALAFNFIKALKGIKAASIALAVNPAFAAIMAAVGAAALVWKKWKEIKDLREQAEKGEEKATQMEGRLKQIKEIKAIREKAKAMKESSEERIKLEEKANALEKKYNKKYNIKKTQDGGDDEKPDNVAESIETEKQLYKDTIKLIGQRTSALDSFIKMQQVSGNISIKDTKQRISLIKEDINQQLEYNKILKDRQEKEIQNLKISLREEKIDAKKDVIRLNLIRKQEQMNKLRKEEFDLQAQSLEISNKTVEAYNMRLSILGKEAGIAKGMVSLMDNFAIGVGASAEMRMKAVNAVQNEIQVLEKQRRQQQIILSQDSSNETAKNKLLEIEGKILNKQQEQAGMLKTLRDGWVSAIGAMNTGAGRYSKIIMSAQKNTAGLVSMGAELSAYSGSYRGGYAGGTKYSGLSQGGFTNQQIGVGGRKGGAAYGTRMTDLGGDMLEAGLRGDISSMSRMMNKINKNYGGRKRLEGMAKSDQPYAMGAIGEESHLGKNKAKNAAYEMWDIFVRAWERKARESSPDIPRRTGGG